MPKGEPGVVVGLLWPNSAPPSGILRLLENRIFHVFSGIFWSSWISTPNSAFSIRILTAAVHAPKVINHAKTDERTYVSSLNMNISMNNSKLCYRIVMQNGRIIVRNQRPRNDRNRDNRRDWLWCEDHMCLRSVNALLRCSIKRSTLIDSSSLEAPLQTGW